MKKISIALLIIGLQLLSAKSLSFQHYDWQVVCDNTNTCRVAGYSSDDSDGYRVSVLITREAGVRKKMKAELQLALYGEDDEKLFKSFPSSFKLEMFINGKSHGFVSMKNSELISSLTTKQTEALVNSLSKSSEIVWKYKKYKWQLSDEGSTAVLLKADEFQKRLNTVTAFYKKGSRSEKNVLKAKKIPTIYAQKVDDKEMIVKDKAYIEKVRSALYSRDEQCFESDYQGDVSLKFYSLNASKMIVTKSAWVAAYNEGYCTWVVNKKEPYKPQGAVEGSYYVDGNIGTVSNSQKWRGLGDCWSYEEHVWTRESLEERSVGSTGLCRLIAGGGAWSLPTFVSNVKVGLNTNERLDEIKKSNKSYQAYQEFDEYDILYRLVKNSNYLHLLDYYTNDLEYWGDIDHHITKKGTLFMLVRNARKIIKNGKNRYITMPLDAIEFNPINNSFTDGNDNPLPLKYPKVWLKIFKIYHQSKSKEFLFIKEKSSLYKKPNSKSKSKKFLIKNDCALIVDKTDDGWYQLFYYHPHWNTNTVMWIKFDAEKHRVIKGDIK